jgi:hypothetical protein
LPTPPIFKNFVSTLLQDRGVRISPRLHTCTQDNDMVFPPFRDSQLEHFFSGFSRTGTRTFADSFQTTCSCCLGGCLTWFVLSLTQSRSPGSSLRLQVDVHIVQGSELATINAFSCNVDGTSALCYGRLVISTGCGSFFKQVHERSPRSILGT